MATSPASQQPRGQPSPQVAALDAPVPIGAILMTQVYAGIIALAMPPILVGCLVLPLYLISSMPFSSL